MKKFLSLVRNESLKLWGQTSWRVMTIILASLLIIIPALNLLLEKAGDWLFSDISYEEYYEYAQTARENGQELQAVEHEVYYQAGKYFADLGLDTDSAEYSVYYDYYLDLLLAESSLNLLESGKYTVESLNNEYYSSIDPIYYFLIDYGYYDDTDDMDYYQYNILSIVSTAFSDKSAQEWLTAVGTELDSIRFNIENFSIKHYYNEVLAEIDYNIELYEEAAVKNDKTLQSDISETDAVYYEELAVYYKDVITCYKAYRRDVEFLINNSCEYGGWQYKTVMELSSKATATCSYSMPQSDDDMQSNGFFYSVPDEYNEQMRNERLLAIEALEYAHYSLENSIPMPKLQERSSTKTLICGQFRVFIGIMTVLFICYGGITTANEYSSGTVRLLLIKPRSRTKILFSKFASLAFWWVVMALQSAIMLTLINVVFFGIGDLFVPDLKAMRSGIVEIPSIVSGLGVMGEEMVIALLYITLAVFFAVVTKKAALSVLFPMLASIGAATAQSICLTLYEYGASFLAYMPFFYLDFAPFHAIAPDYFIMNWGVSDMLSLSSMYLSVNIILGKHASIPLGIAMIGALVAAFVAIAVSVFRKQKI